MIQSKDQYNGEREPKNRLRHGHGIYTYDNGYFQYEGEWVNGKKHGHGILRMNAPSGINNNQSSQENTNADYCKNYNFYEGDFYEGEITGKGVYSWANGNLYEGEFLQGEKHGQGEFTSEAEYYNGQWQYNQYSGQGVLQRENGDKIKGQFLEHLPHGECEIKLGNGDEYIGQLEKGLKHGKGDFKNQKLSYLGDYFKDLKQGQGCLQFQSGFKYDGEWDNDQPILTANRLQITQIKEEVELEVEQTGLEDKKKQDNSKKQIEEPSTGIEYEILGKPFSFEIKSLYQPPQIEDPNQPTQEEIEELEKNWQKENKKNKNPPPMPDFAQPKMIDPPMVDVTQESGRNIKCTLIFELDPEKGKEQEPRQIKTFKLDYRKDILNRRQEIEQIKLQREEQERLEAEQEQQQAKGGKKPAKKDTKKAGKSQPQTQDEQQVLLFKEDEEEYNKPLYVRNVNGSIKVENLEFPEDFPPTQGGTYYIQVEDWTGEEVYGKVELTKIELVINPVGGGDPKKKKK